VIPAASKRPGKRRRKAASCGFQKQEQEPVDPITLEPIPSKFKFVFDRPNGSQVAFNAISLSDYMLASGDFTDPLTRVPFQVDDLERLDSVARRVGGSERKSVLKASQESSKQYSASRTDRDAVLGLERYLGEQVGEMLELVEAVNNEEIELDAAESMLLSAYLPTFQQNFEILANTDKCYARQCLEQYESFILGPPNRPIRNNKSFRDYVVAVLHMFQPVA